MEILNGDILAKLEALIIGSDDFRIFESKTDQFCPFEATGMVRQEIRHSHFLSYILDPNRPHEFGNLLLKEFLFLMTEGTVENEQVFSKLNFHFMDLSNVRVLREWKHIDILIEIPSQSENEQGLVIAIENKIDAGQHGDQLARYQSTINTEYPEHKWNREFVFLTIGGIPAGSRYDDIWQPMALGDLISRFETTILPHVFSGPSAETFRAYTTMLRRHILENSELENLARKIWSQHREALEFLSAYAPDLNGEILTVLGEDHIELADMFSRITGMTIVPEESTRTILRFAIQDWDHFPKCKSGDGSWVSSGRILMIELMQWGKNQFRISLVIGPGDADTREDIYQAVLLNKEIKIGRRTPSANAKWKHLSSAIVLNDKTLVKAENDGRPAKDLISQISTKSGNFIKRELPIYDSIIRGLFIERPMT